MPAALEKDFTRFWGMLYLAFDLGEVYWTLGFTVGPGQRPREVRILSGNMVRLEREIAEAKCRFGMKRAQDGTAREEYRQAARQPTGRADQWGRSRVGSGITRHARWRGAVFAAAVPRTTAAPQWG